jgi:hypothetical protein
MEQTTNTATAGKDTSSKVQELAVLSKRLDFSQRKGVNWGIPMPSEAKNVETGKRS